ncbi:NO-inducible flavohemoprotein [Ferrimonas senticii]|uniref:NO-inducible flavohemoprotein n=1 Tax=Ferrimonas senticii TaxID=394566 RepID=UPI000408CD0E|nr:NO-inducible flavohemoprotein [Ferrimonas senticii]
MLDSKTIAVVKSTIPLLVAAGPELTKHFYQRLFRHHPELKDTFNLAHQHKGDQPVALFNAVAAYASNIDNLGALAGAVEKIAQKHTGFLITPEQYDVVGFHLLETLKELGGEAVTEEVLEAWGKAYGVLAQIFINREAQIYNDAAAATGGWRGTRQFQISAKTEESALITSFELTPVDGQAVVAYHAGQYLSLKLEHPTLENIEIRQYSLSDASNGQHYRISVKREANGIASNLLHDHYQVGDEVALIPPAGDFFLKSDDAAPVTLISAGVGLTPMLSMLNQRLPQAPHNTVWLHACDNGAVHAFAADIKRKQAQYPDFAAYHWYREPQTDDVQSEQYDFAGTMKLAEVADQLTISGDFYLCGPLAFMSDLKAQLLQLGVAEANIHYEVFGPHKGL